MFGTANFDENQGALLNQKLGPEYISDRAGPGGKKVQYIEGWRAVETANQVLGFNGWSSQIVSQNVDFIDQDSSGLKFSVGVCSTIRITLKDGSYREDVGYGLSENNKSKGNALENARKSSVTDGIKRTLKHFGNALGGCFNSKDYLKSIRRVGKPMAKELKIRELRRHPDYVIAQNQNCGTSMNTSSTSARPLNTEQRAPPPQPKSMLQPEEDCFSDVDDTLDYAEINLDNYPSQKQKASVSIPLNSPKGLPRSISEGFSVNKNWNPTRSSINQPPKNEPPCRTSKRIRIEDFDIPGFT